MDGLTLMFIIMGGSLLAGLVALRAWHGDQVLDAELTAYVASGAMSADTALRIRAAAASTSVSATSPRTSPAA